MPFEMTEEEKAAAEATEEQKIEAEAAAAVAAEAEPAGLKPGEPAYTKAVQERMNVLTREKHDARRETERIKVEKDALQRKVDAGIRPTPPDPEQFTDPATGGLDRQKFQSALVAYEDGLHSWRQAQSGVAVASAVEEVVADTTTFRDRSVGMREKHADFDEVVERPVFTPDMREAVVGSDQGPEIAYHLGKNQAEAMRIGALPPASILKEIGKLEARFSAESTRRTVSGAPPPITPVEGTATVTREPDDKTPTAEWMAHDRQQRLEKIKKAQTL